MGTMIRLDSLDTLDLRIWSVKGLFLALQKPHSERRRRGLVFESHVRSNLIVVNVPCLRDGLNLGQGGEPVNVKEFVT